MDDEGHDEIALPPSATANLRATRGGFARSPGRGVSLATKTIAPLQSPGCTARSPGFLLARFSGPRIRAECADPNAPLAESEYARVSETRWSGFESRVGYQHFSRERKPSPALLQLGGCGKEAPPRVQRADRPRGGAACSRRLMVRTAALQAAHAGSIPAGNANAIQLAVAQPASAPRSGRNARVRSFGAQVRRLPARPTMPP